MERRYLTFDKYEAGKLRLDEYLHCVVFYEKGTFSLDDVRNVMLRQSKPYPGMIEWMQTVKSRNKWKVVAVNDEGRELATHRTEKSDLGDIIDFFVFSSFLHFRETANPSTKAHPERKQVKPMKKVFHVGDHVGWNSEAGHVRGTIKKKITSAITFKGYTVRASREEPQYLIKSDTTAHLAMHKGSALKKLKSKQ